MAFKTPGKGLTRTKPLQAKGGLKSGTPLKASPATPTERKGQEKKAMQTATLRALDKVRRDAGRQGVELSDWESKFIEGISERVKTYGRAFADPEKGAMNGTLSLRQGVKLREIRKKARGKEDKA